jgi:hypothetical protein
LLELYSRGWLILHVGVSEQGKEAITEKEYLDTFPGRKPAIQAALMALWSEDHLSI